MRPRVVKRGVDDFATIEYGNQKIYSHMFNIKKYELHIWENTIAFVSLFI